MKLSLIHEADMSRRGFLKLLGKGAAAAYGAPLGSLEKLGSLGKLGSAAVDSKKYYAYGDINWPSSGPGRAYGPTRHNPSGYQGSLLSTILHKLIEHYTEFTNFLGDDNVFTTHNNTAVHDDVFKVLNANGLKRALLMAKSMGLDVRHKKELVDEEQDYYWEEWNITFPNGNTIQILDEDFTWSKEQITSNPLVHYANNYIKEYSSTSIHVDAKGEKLLRNAGYSEQDMQGLKNALNAKTELEKQHEIESRNSNAEKEVERDKSQPREFLTIRIISPGAVITSPLTDRLRQNRRTHQSCSVLLP